MYIFNYYINKYPLLDSTLLDNILKGIEPFANMFKHSGIIEIDDNIIHDEINSIVFRGDYPLDIYKYKLNILDQNGNSNIIRFNFKVM